MVIAVFYTDQISIAPVIGAVLCFALLTVATRMKSVTLAVYAFSSPASGSACSRQGFTTIAGILVATVVPVRAHLKPKRFFATAHQKLAELEASNLSSETARLDPEQMEALAELHEAISDVVPAGHAFEHYLHPVTACLILPCSHFSTQESCSTRESAGHSRIRWGSGLCWDLSRANRLELRSRAGL